MTNLAHANNPFEGIKHIDSETGQEYWLARELMRLIQYSRWEDFENPIRKAMSSLETFGINPQEHIRQTANEFRDVHNRIRKEADYCLTRHGCNIVFQNCDPNKPMIAQAQAYYSLLDLMKKQKIESNINNKLYLKKELVASIEREEELERRNKVLEQENQAKEAKILQDAPIISRWQSFMDSDGLFSFGVAAKILYNINDKIGRNRLFKLLADNKYISRIGEGEHKFWEPYQDKMKYFKVKSTIIRRSKGSYEYPQIFITPRGLEHIADKFFGDEEVVWKHKHVK